MNIFTSNWAADSAKQNYNVSCDRVKVVPFGANVSMLQTQEGRTSSIMLKSKNCCKLLFLGVDWERKGGEKAIEITKSLRKQGVNTELHIAGSGVAHELPAYIINHGYLKKNTAEGKEKLDQLLGQSHFLLLPTIADCVPVVIAEANSYSLPVITNNVGGIASAVENGVNGWAFSPNEKPKVYAEKIKNYFNNKEIYSELALSSFEFSKAYLNWDKSGKKVRGIFKELGLI